MTAWNPQLQYANILERVDEETVVFHKVFKAKKCLTEFHRDFVFWERVRHLDDGTIVILALSSEAQKWSEKTPVPEKCIRGFVHCSGWVLQP